MRKLTWLLVLSTLLFACNNNVDESKFNIKGTVKNAEGKKIILSQNLTGQSLNSIDTTVIDKDGTFILSADIKTPDLLYLQVEGSQQIIGIIGEPKTTLEFSSKLDSFATAYTLTGSKEADLLTELTKKEVELIEKINDLDKQLKTQNADQDSIYKEFGKLIKQHQEYLLAFIDKNPESLASVMALFQSVMPGSTMLNPRDHKESFEKVTNALTAKYPESHITKSLKEYMDRVNNPQPQPQVETFPIGSNVPAIELPSPDGKKINLNVTKGKYVLLDFWASWCGPCRRENPTLVENYKKYKSKGFTIFQVSLDKNSKDWTNAIAKDKLQDWYHVSELKSWQSAIVQTYKIKSIPTNYLLDPEGKIIASNLRGVALGEKLKEIFKF